MITPAKQLSILFNADNSSEAFEFDITLPPVSEDVRGAGVLTVANPAVTSGPTGPLEGVTASITGSVVTFTFSTPPVKYDDSDVLITYTASFLLQYGN